MITPSKFRTILLLTIILALQVTSYAQADEYEWLKSPAYETIFVFTDFKECEFMADKLNETVQRTFSRANIKTTVSNSLVFKTTNENRSSVYELVDEELTGNNKIILYIYGKCIRYASGFIYQFDINFGVNDTTYSQALLYAAPRHSVIGVDSLMGIDRTFRTLMKNAVDDYCSANQGASGGGQHQSIHLRSSR